jgi:hypothetical protein
MYLCIFSRLHHSKEEEEEEEEFANNYDSDDFIFSSCITFDKEIT